MAAKAKSGNKKAAKPLNAQKSSVYSRNAFESFFPTKPNQTMEKIMSQSKSQMDKFAQDGASFGRENVEAFIKSSTIFAKGFEDILRQTVALAQSAAEKQAQYVNQAMSSKTLNEWSEVQNKIAQTNFDDFMAGATKISELSIKVLTESAEPLNDQLGKSIKKASDSMAA